MKALSKKDRKLLEQSRKHANDLLNAALTNIKKSINLMTYACENADRGLRLLNEIDELEDTAKAQFGVSILKNGLVVNVKTARQGIEGFLILNRGHLDKSTQPLDPPLA